MTLFHSFDSLTDTKGNSLSGYQVIVRGPSSGPIQSIYADANMTPIYSVSGIVNTALTDSAGNWSFFVVPGTYDLEFRDANGTYLRTVAGATLLSGQTGPAGADGQDGATGPADNTYTSYAAMQASDPTRKSARLVGDTDTPAHPDGPYSNPTQAIGGWIAQSASGIVFQPAGTGAVERSHQDKSRDTVSVLDFYLPTDPDFTAAFNRAVATGKTVFVPQLAGGYPVNGIAWVSNMSIIGEKSGECLGPELIVNTNNAAAFIQSAATPIVTHGHFANFTIRAASGVTGARGFLSQDKSKYSAYLTFDSIETHKSLTTSYEALFIYATWDNVRDGYLGTGTSHGFIRSEAASYGQTNATNTCRIVNSRIFGAVGVDAAVQIAYGDDWLFDGVRWENMDTPLVKAASIESVRVLNNRIENIRSTELFTLNAMLKSDGTSSGVGSTLIQDNCVHDVDAAGMMMARTDGLSRVGFSRCGWSILGTGAKLTNNPLALLFNRDHIVIAGAGAAGFMTGMMEDRRAVGRQYYNGAIDNGIANMTMQNAGGIAASQGFLSGHDIAVGTSFTTIATSQTGLGGVLSVSGYDPSTGTQYRFLKNWLGAIIQDANAPINPTGKTFTFQTSGNDLQMKVDTGSVVVFTTLLH